MTQAITANAARPRLPAHRLIVQERRFYLLASIVLLAITLYGFRAFLVAGKGADGLPITPQILSLVVVHGVALLAWVALLVLQCALVVLGKRRLHLALGRLGALLAAAIVVLSVATAVLSARFNPALYQDFGGARYFLAFSLAATVMFGTLVGLGIHFRARPEVHRPLMLLATVAMMTGPFDRWPFIPWLMDFAAGHVPLYHWGPMLLLGAGLLAVHAAMTRRVSRCHALGYGGVLLATTTVSVVAGTTAWDGIAALLLS